LTEVGGGTMVSANISASPLVVLSTSTTEQTLRVPGSKTLAIDGALR
jgi:hypothetical protein